MAVQSSFTIDSYFEPTSFKDMVLPLTYYKNTYDTQEKKLEDMTDKAAALKWIAEQNPDSQTARLYNSMMDRIADVSEQLTHTRGLTPSVRHNVLALREPYSANTAEILRRQEAMEKYRTAREELAAKDPSIRFAPGANGGMATIDDFAGGQRPELRYISGEKIAARGQAAMAALTSREFKNSVEGRLMGDQYWNYVQENGMDNAALNELFEHLGQSDFPILNKVIGGIQKEYADYGKADIDYFNSRLMEGMNAGAQYKQTVSPQRNLNFMSDADRRKTESQRSQEREADGSNKRNFETRAVFSSKERVKADTFAKNWNDYVKKGYLTKTKDGNWVVSQKGSKECYQWSSTDRFGNFVNINTPFRQFLINNGLSEIAGNQVLDKITGKRSFLKKHHYGQGLDKIINTRLTKTANYTDTNAATEYYRNIDSSDYDAVIGAFGRAAHKGKVTSYERVKSKDSYEWQATGDTIDISSDDLKKDNIIVAQVVFGKHGNYLQTTLKNGKTYTVPVASYSSSYSENVKANITDAQNLSTMLNSGKNNGDGTVTYKGETYRIAELQDALIRSLNYAGDNMILSLGAAKPKTEEVKTEQGEQMIWQ